MNNGDCFFYRISFPTPTKSKTLSSIRDITIDPSRRDFKNLKYSDSQDFSVFISGLHVYDVLHRILMSVKLLSYPLSFNIDHVREWECGYELLSSVDHQYIYPSGFPLLLTNFLLKCPRAENNNFTFLLP